MGAPTSLSETGASRPLNLARRARASGMNPNHWYPGAFSDELKKKKIVSTQFWGTKIALYRSDKGTPHAVLDRCPHRGIPLSHGSVEGNEIVCLYHGWCFNPAGELTDMKHDKFGKKLPVVSVRSYPTRERYGIVWFFPGDAELAELTPLPSIPVAEGDNRWVSIHFAYTWAAHHSMIIDNLCNLTHLWVHGSWVPYGDTVLGDSSANGDRLTLRWDHDLRRDVFHPFVAPFFHEAPDSNQSETFMIYDYPYQSARSNNRVLSTNFMLPIDEKHTKVFSYQLWQPSQKLRSKALARAMAQAAMPVIKPIAMEIFRQDGFTVEEEQVAYDKEPEQPIPEPNPMVKRFNQLTVRKWEDYLALSDREMTAEELAEQRRVKVLWTPDSV